MKESLINLGLTENETKVYINLLELGLTTAGKIIKSSRLHRNIVYDNLERLIKKGLVSHVIIKGIKHFETTPPNELNEYIENKKKNIKKQEEDLKGIISKIKELRGNKKHSAKASVYEGKKAVKTVFEEFTNPKHEVLILGTGKMKEYMPEYYNQWNRKVKENKTKVRAIISGSTKEKYNVHYKIKTLPKSQSPPTAIAIHGNTTINIIWQEEPIIIKMQSKEIADSYRTYFEYLWKQAR